MYVLCMYAWTLIFMIIFYTCRRNKISKATKLAWLGNTLPLFRGNQPNQAKLSGLVNELKETCTTKYFNEESIREHIIDSIHERRRAVNKGYDYEMVANCLTYINSMHIHISYIINQNA